MAIDTAELSQPIFRNTPKVPAASDRIWRGEIEQAAYDAAPEIRAIPPLTAAELTMPEAQANVPAGERHPVSVSPFVGNVLTSMMDFQNGNKMVEYLDWVGDLAINGGSPEISTLPQQLLSSQDELLMAGEGTDAWIERIRREATEQGIAVREHPQYSAYELRVADLDELGWLADRIEESKKIPPYVAEALGMYLSTEPSTPEAVQPIPDVLWRGTNDHAAPVPGREGSQEVALPVIDNKVHEPISGASAERRQAELDSLNATQYGNLVENVLFELDHCESAEEALEYLRNLGLQTIYGKDSEVCAWQIQNGKIPEGYQSPECLADLRRRLQNESNSRGISLEDHEEYGAYSSKLAQLREVRALTHRINDTRHVPAVIAEYREATGIYADALPWGVAKERRDKEITSAAENITALNYGEIVTMRQLLDSRRWVFYSIEGLTEVARIITPMGRLALGSDTAALAVSEAVRTRYEHRLADKRSVIINAVNNEKPDYRIRGSRRTERGVKVARGCSTILKSAVQPALVSNTQTRRSTR